MNHVFLSHSSADKPFVRMLADDIRRSGAEIWLDELELEAGDSLIGGISIAVQNARYVVACLSPHSVKSRWVREELEIAATLGIELDRVVVVPLLLADCVRPAFLIHRLYCDFRRPDEYDRSFQMLLRRVQPTAVPKTEHSRYALTLDGSRSSRLIEVARDPRMNAWVVDYLLSTVDARKSHKERYFSHITLGEIGDKRATECLRRGLEDSNEFARSGAQAALDRLLSRE
jgi:hypothetical protein